MSLKSELAQLAASATIEKLLAHDFSETVREELAELWVKTERSNTRNAAKSGQTTYEFVYHSECGATRDELTELLPLELYDMRPFVWRSTSEPDKYDVVVKWKDERDTLIKEFESKQQSERKRARDDGDEGAQAGVATEEPAPFTPIQPVRDARRAPPPAPKKSVADSLSKWHNPASDNINYKDQHVVYDDPGGNELIARCNVDKGAWLCIDMGSQDCLTYGHIKRDIVKGIANLTGHYVNFQHEDHPCKFSNARVTYDNGYSKISVSWYDTEELEHECTLELERTRVKIIHDQYKAALEDRAARLPG